MFEFIKKVFITLLSFTGSFGQNVSVVQNAYL